MNFKVREQQLAVCTPPIMQFVPRIGWLLTRANRKLCPDDLQSIRGRQRETAETWVVSNEAPDVTGLLAYP